MKLWEMRNYLWQGFYICFSFFAMWMKILAALTEERPWVLEEFSIKTNLLIFKNVTIQEKQTRMREENVSQLRLYKYVVFQWEKPEAGGWEPNSVHCRIISHHAEICPHEATSLIHQLCQHNKPYSWHLLSGDDSFSSARQQFNILVRGFTWLVSIPPQVSQQFVTKMFLFWHLTVQRQSAHHWTKICSLFNVLIAGRCISFATFNSSQSLFT